MFKKYKTINLKYDKSTGVSRVTMSRPDVHNAFNEDMIRELTECFESLNNDSKTKIIVLQSTGSSFSAGADVNWMKSMITATEAENKLDSQKLAKLLRTINFNTKPTIARVQGLALGGGVGLICCCDIVIASDQAKFGLTEAKLGLVPAVISPYVIDAIGIRHARRYFQSAEIFDANKALNMGIVSEVYAESALDEMLERQIKFLSTTGPNAKEICKKLVVSVVGRTLAHQKQIDEYTTQVIAAVRVSSEGQKGLNSFVNKESPDW
ncbi:MAG: enoyl-CoA hydratase-related protein [Proteobacteria bacterium]|nr:enoyl-CoA hydratase-related protein [Pseudomonadota bacterium]